MQLKDKQECKQTIFEYIIFQAKSKQSNNLGISVN